MNAQPDSLSRPVPSRRRFKTLMEEARRKRRGSVGTALTASTPTLSPSQAGVRMSSTGQTPSTSPFHAFIRPYVWIFSVLAILSVVGTLLELARPLASKYIINNLGAFCWSASNQAGEVMPPQTRTSGPTCSTGASGPTCFRLRKTALPWLFARFRRAGPCRPG